MQLEWDERKRQETLASRGLDFADVPLVDMGTVLTLPDTRHDYGEPRFSSYGLLEGVLIQFCWTPRADKIRIISLRKANDRERKKYLQAQRAGNS